MAFRPAVSIPPLVLLCAALGGCGSEGGPITSAMPDGATSTPPSGAVDDAGTTGCSFVRVEGTTKAPWAGTARAKMNGSGNLVVRCDGEAGTSDADTSIDLAFGNGSFDGPRTYVADDFGSDGAVRFAAPTSNFQWTTSTQGSSCLLILTEGQVDARGSSVPRGSRVVGTFSCTALTSPDPAGVPSFAVESGSFVATVA
jgi:hypothetical protein